MTTITHSVVELTGIDGVDGCWVLDRFSHPRLGMSRTAVVLGQAKVAGVGPAAVQLGDRLAGLVAQRSLPADLVVAAVPSATAITEALAGRVAAASGRRKETLFGVRGGVLGRLDGSVRGRIKPKMRRTPAHVLLVDDAVRSGETLRACAAMLRERGTERVWAVAAVALADVAGFDAAGFD